MALVVTNLAVMLEGPGYSSVGSAFVSSLEICWFESHQSIFSKPDQNCSTVQQVDLSLVNNQGQTILMQLVEHIDGKFYNII